MEMLSSLLLFVLAIAIILYVLLTEGLDWVGRAEIVETRWPFLWGIMNNRPMRLVLIVIAIVLVIRAGEGVRVGAERPDYKFPPLPIASQAEALIDPIIISRQATEISNLKKQFASNEDRLADHCWFGPSFPTNAAQPLVTQTIVFCNYSLAIPWSIAVSFDVDTEGSGSVIPQGAKEIESPGGNIQGKMLTLRMNKPSVKTYWPMFLFIQTSKPVRIVGIKASSSKYR